jgi:hypothetical protein
MDLLRYGARIALCVCLATLIQGVSLLSQAKAFPQLFKPSVSGAPLQSGGSLLPPVSGYNPSGDTVSLCSGMFGQFFPTIPNLKFGFLYNFGPDINSTRANVDYVLPISLSPKSVLFGEFHGEYQDFFRRANNPLFAASGTTVTRTDASNRVDLSAGGGFRRLVTRDALVGVNSFFDTSRIFDKWYSSGGVGLEFAANMGDYDMVDLNVNAYGNFFNTTGLVNAFRNQGTSYDIEGGYSHALLNQTLDLRLNLAGYQYDAGAAVYGWRTGANLTTRDGVFTLRYEYGDDKINGPYNIVGGFVNIGFQLDNLVRGENPFSPPEPVFKSPRNLANQLVQSVKRDWHQPSAVVIAKSSTAQSGAAGGCDTTRFINNPFSLITGLPAFTGTHAFATPVPYTCLSPAGTIVVSFHYDFGVTPAFISFAPAVFNNTFLVLNSGLLTILAPVSPSGDVSITLTTGGGQNAFILAPTDPANVTVSGFVVGGASVTISNVQVLFNQ